MHIFVLPIQVGTDAAGTASADMQLACVDDSLYDLLDMCVSILKCSTFSIIVNETSNN